MIKLIISRKHLVKEIDVSDGSRDKLVYTICFYNAIGNGFKASIHSDVIHRNEFSQSEE